MDAAELAMEANRRNTGAKAPKIFLSIGRPLCDEQREFKLALIGAVRARGFEPRTVGGGAEDSDVPHDRPIEQVRRIIHECDGAIVVAYEKHLAKTLVTNSRAAQPGELEHVRFTTSWNQAEAAMAYHAELPLLLVSEEGVLGECILEEGTVGAVAHVPIRKEAVLDEVFQKRMTSWANDVLERKQERARKRTRIENADDLTLREVFELFGNLSWRAGLFLLGALFALLSTAYYLGSLHILGI